MKLTLQNKISFGIIAVLTILLILSRCNRPAPAIGNTRLYDSLNNELAKKQTMLNEYAARDKKLQETADSLTREIKQTETHYEPIWKIIKVKDSLINTLSVVELEGAMQQRFDPH